MILFINVYLSILLQTLTQMLVYIQRRYYMQGQCGNVGIHFKICSQKVLLQIGVFELQSFKYLLFSNSCYFKIKWRVEMHIKGTITRICSTETLQNFAFLVLLFAHATKFFKGIMKYCNCKNTKCDFAFQWKRGDFRCV